MSSYFYLDLLLLYFHKKNILNKESENQDICTTFLKTFVGHS